jgi:2'-5' RNA ligase
VSVRLFAALSLPDDLAERLTKLMQGVPGAKWRPKENLHLTLCFFGDVDEGAARELDAELEQVRVRPFDLSLKGTGVFGGADPRALWMGSERPPELLQLNKACIRAAKRAGVGTERRAYSPHVTLAYLRDPDRSRLARFIQRTALYETPAFRVNSFSLFSSWAGKKGPNDYVEEAVYPLN